MSRRIPDRNHDSNVPDFPKIQWHLETARPTARLSASPREVLRAFDLLHQWVRSCGARLTSVLLVTGLY
jgi:hypothetical protein